MTKNVAATLDRITDAARDEAVAGGLPSLTVAKVSQRAGVSSALIHYHFSTKRQLIAAAAGRLADQRRAARQAALAARALDALDALWAVIQAAAEGGGERAWLELSALARDDAEVRGALATARLAERAHLVARLPSLLAELGASRAAASEELAAGILGLLDGLALALVAGEAPASVRAAYDAFWLAMIAAGQPGRRR